MKSSYLFVITALLASASTLVHASDPDPLQDFCVGTNSSLSGVFVNGQLCKDPKIVTADDFSFNGLLTPGNTLNPLGINVNLINVEQFPGLNTIGVSIAHVDYALEGLNPPHLHPRASEILVCIEGTLLAGFVTSSPANRLFTKVLNPGDAFLFPKGLIHFQRNVGKTNALAIAALTSQNPGRVNIANAVFGSKIPLDVLEKAFQVDKKVIDALTKPFRGNNNSPINLKSVTSFGTPPSGSWAKE